jgi:hypothetical protein
MDEPERDYLRQQLQDLERSKRRWKLATFILAAVLVINLILGGASSVFVLQRHRVMMQQALAERERARAAEEAAHQLRQRENADERKQP